MQLVMQMLCNNLLVFIDGIQSTLAWPASLVKYSLHVCTSQAQAPKSFNVSLHGGEMLDWYPDVRMANYDR